MQIFLKLGDDVTIQMTTESMSARGAADYEAEAKKLEHLQARREEIMHGVENSPAAKSFKKAETQVLGALYWNHSALEPEIMESLMALKNPQALAIASQLIDINLEEAKAQRMIAIIARDEFYDIQMKRARAANADLDAQYLAQADKAKTSKEAARDLAENADYYATDMVKLRLEDLHRFDKAFFKSFNGDMLDAIHRYEEAQMRLAAREITQPVASVSEKPEIRPAPSSKPAFNT